MNLEQLVRPNIRALKAYASARSEYGGSDAVFLDANEHPLGPYNRYPDPTQQELKQCIACKWQADPAQLFIGNGSDEVIDLVFRICCEPGQDKALSFMPSYGMYEVSAQINNVELLQLPLNDHFDIEWESIALLLEDPALKVILLCSPNNPTGNLLDAAVITRILKTFKGLVVIDEAYIDFADQASWLKRLDEFPNLLICQTLSKAWAMAALRLGLAWMSPELLYFFNKVKPPYNISAVNQRAAIDVLTNETSFEEKRNQLMQEKARLVIELSQLKRVQEIYRSDANFLLIRVNDAAAVYKALRDQHIIVRNRDAAVKDTLRITIGTASENQQLINVLQQIDHA